MREPLIRPSGKGEQHCYACGRRSWIGDTVGLHHDDCLGVENEALRAEVAFLTQGAVDLNESLRERTAQLAKAEAEVERLTGARDYQIERADRNVEWAREEKQQRRLLEAGIVTQPAVLRWLRAHGWGVEADTIELGSRLVEAAAQREAGR